MDIDTFIHDYLLPILFIGFVFLIVILRGRNLRKTGANWEETIVYSLNPKKDYEKDKLNRSIELAQKKIELLISKNKINNERKSAAVEIGQFKTLIANNRINDALSELSKIDAIRNDPHIFDQLILIRSKHSDIQSKYNTGQISYEEKVRYDMQVKNAIIGIINTINSPS